MKIYLRLALLLLTHHAANALDLAWDPSSTPDVQYRLYAHTNTLAATNLTAALVKLDAGTNRTAKVETLQPARWYFWATAYTAQGIESVPSNELVAEVPAPPANMRTVQLQFNATVTGTNWLDAGYFRIKFGNP